MSQAHFQRLISSDDHVDLSQDQVKVHLHRKHHDSYDAAVAQVEAELRGRNNVEVNRRWREQQSLPPLRRRASAATSGTRRSGGPAIPTLSNGLRTWTPTASRHHRATAR